MLKSVVPKLPFINLQVTKDYYLNQLGFSLINEYPDYLLIQKDAIELHFFAYPKLNPRKSDFMIYIRVENDIDLMYEELQSKGVKIHPNAPLEIKPWRQREFALLDPNGTLLTFGQSV